MRFTEKQSEAMYKTLQNIVRNAPDDIEPPKENWKWTMWIAGNEARLTLHYVDTAIDVRPNVIHGDYTVMRMLSGHWRIWNYKLGLHHDNSYLPEVYNSQDEAEDALRKLTIE